MDEQLALAFAKISGQTMSGKVVAFFRILNKWPQAKKLSEYFGDANQYTNAYLSQNPHSKAAKIVRQGTLLKFEHLFEQALGGNVVDGGELAVKFNSLDAGSKAYLANIFIKQLEQLDSSVKSKPVNKPQKNAQEQTAKSEPVNTVEKSSAEDVPSKKDSKNVIPEQQKHLSTNFPNRLSKHALLFLNNDHHQVKLDGSFVDHKAVLPWQDELEVNHAVSKSSLTTAVGQMRGFVLDGPTTNFLSWLKEQFSLHEVLKPHALELAFNSKRGLRKVARGTQLEAIYLIARFSVENDWNGLAAVFHGRYATEYALRRKQGWGKLSVADTSAGVVDDLLTGDFDRTIPSILVETAFWYYLSRWAYLKVDTSKQKDGAYLKHDESNYSQEAQRILSTIRQDHGPTEDVKQQSELSQLKNDLRRLLNSEQDLRGLVGVLLAHELLAYASDPSHNNFPQQLTDSEGKVTKGTQNTIAQYLTQDPVVAQFERIIQQAVPELGKRISEYQQGEKLR